MSPTSFSINDRECLSVAKTNRILSIMLVMAWMALIFTLSSHDAEQSSELSSGVTDAIIRIIENLEPNIRERIDMTAFHGFIRSLAHFAIYFVLGIFSANMFSQFFRDWFRIAVDGALFTLVVATFDEIYQSTVPGRAMMLSDVFIDTLGGLLGVTLLVLMIFKGFKRS